MSQTSAKPPSLLPGLAAYVILMAALLVNWGLWSLAPGTPLWVHIGVSLAMGVVVLLVYMEMVDASRPVVFAAVCGPLFVAVLFAIIIADYATRPDHWRDDPFRSQVTATP